MVKVDSSQVSIFGTKVAKKISTREMNMVSHKLEGETRIDWRMLHTATKTTVDSESPEYDDDGGGVLEQVCFFCKPNNRKKEKKTNNTAHNN